MTTPPLRHLLTPAVFIGCVRRGDIEQVRDWLDKGFKEINFREDHTGMTALHYAAALNAVPIVKLLLHTGKCNATVRDHKGRTAATLAIEVADNPVLGRYLYDLQFRQIPSREPDQDAGRRSY